MASRFRLTIREGSKVRHAEFASLDAALTGLAGEVTELSGRLRRPNVDIKTRQFAPAEQVAARVQVSERGRLLGQALGGVDVRGDGSTEAFTGGMRRRVVEPDGRETAPQALRRVLEGG